LPRRLFYLPPKVFSTDSIALLDPSRGIPADRNSIEGLFKLLGLIEGDMRSISLFLAILGAFGLCGCAGFSKDGGFQVVADETRTHLNQDLEWPRTPEEERKVQRQVDEILTHPLTAEDAVQVALLNNRGLRAGFQQLGISEADLVQSGRLANPRFDLRHASAAGQVDIEETLSFNILSLLTMPYAHDIEKRRFAQTQQAVELQIAALANEVRQTYFAAVAAHQAVEYLQQVDTAAQTGAELARRMVAAGNWNSLDQAREQTFYADAVMRLTLARLAEETVRERLTRLLGLAAPPDSSGAPGLQLAGRLPDLPQRIDPIPDVEHSVLEDRIDLRLMRMHIDELARSLHLTKSTRFVNVLELGATREQQGTRDAPHETGVVLTLEVPIFDSGAARVKRSEAIYAQAVDRFAQTAVEARSEVRHAYAAYHAAFELAGQQRDAVVPLRKAVAEQNLLRYNASLISIFELLSDARDQISSVDDYIQSLRDFWIAKSKFDAALLGNSSL
jgi:outer membrane protein TolC